MSLSKYMNQAQTELFNDCGVFFAFSNEQFMRQREDGVKYVNLGSGMLCPKDKATHVCSEMNKIYVEAIKKDIADNTKEKIIERELYNHEAFYTGDCSDVIEKLVDYAITSEQVWSEYYRLSESVQL